MMSAGRFATVPPMTTPLQTVAEATNYRATSRHADVMSYIDKLVAASATSLSVQTMGSSAEGREIPVLVLSAEKLFTPEKARDEHATES